ncbi:MAG: YidB family protein [Rhizobiaceae bacterium]|nr:YidB family protein [Rhizobiaceae bacterium]
MGLFDDAVPGGNITKPLLIALGALLAGRMLSGGGKEEEPEAEKKSLPPQAEVPQPDQTAQQGAPGQGGLLEGGLGGLLEKLANNGHGEVADSWVKTDQPNAPIQPQDLGKAIGDRMLTELSRRTGIPQDQLLDQLSKALPGVVDKLTPEGRVPNNDQVAGQFRTSPW